jgi:bifunctional UDP-N-acetylglucosamine pyrophosphorylase/glucosamine-1-phosphate N-acetyltransferase
VAPINIKDGAYIGSGSVISKNVSRNSLALERNNQIEIKNWAKRKKSK